MADTQAIKDRIDIVQLIQEYIPLKKAGVSWKANCPFHNEKSPSFMVHPERQIWHCFGCSKGGDIFSFVQEMEGLEFPEALKLLADRAGVKLTPATGYGEQLASQRSRILEINTKAAYFFHRVLLDMAASAPARDYLFGQRGLRIETVEEWQIGYIPEQWDLLTKYLLKKGCAIDDLVAAGLTVKRDDADQASGRGFYDRFRGRIMFPIWDVHGSVVGFTGRVLVETERSGGKYVNTPQTAVYDKSRILYGINKARTEIKAKNQAVLVEGQMDVIACHQAGMKNVIAASGTALTKEQLKLIRRYTDQIAIAFDADAAGENAGRRGIAAALEEGMKVKVIQIPDGFAKDADECLKKDPAVWFSAVTDAKGVMEWYFDLAEKKFSLKKPEDRQNIAALLLPEIAHLVHAVEQDFWLKKLGDFLRVDSGIFKQDLLKIRRSLTSNAFRRDSALQQPAVSKIPEQPEDRLLNQLLSTWWGLILAFPALFPESSKNLNPESLVGTFFFDLYDFFKTAYTMDALTRDRLNAFLADPSGERFSTLSLQVERDFPDGLSESAAKAELGRLAQRIGEVWVKKRRQQVTYLIRKAEETGDKAQIDTLLNQLAKF